MYTIRLTQDFQDWLDRLKDQRAQDRIAARLRMAEAGNLGDWKTVGGKLGECVWMWDQAIGSISRALAK